MNIHEISFFEGIEKTVTNEIEKNCSEKSFEKEDVIFEKGDQADYLYFLDQGKVDLFIRDQKRSVCVLTKPGEVFGWSAIVENGIYTSSSICLEKTTVLQVPKEVIKEIFSVHPNAAVTFYQRIGTVFSKRLTNAIG